MKGKQNKFLKLDLRGGEDEDQERNGNNIVGEIATHRGIELQTFKEVHRIENSIGNE